MSNEWTFKFDGCTVFADKVFDDPAEVINITAEMPDFEAYCHAKIKSRNGVEDAPPEHRALYQEPLLTREQEFHLFRQMHYYRYRASKSGKKKEIADCLSKSKEIGQKLFSCNTRLVMGMAKKQQKYWSNTGITLLYEMVSDGNLGLLRAIEHYDWRMGTKFSTYATWAVLRAFKQGWAQRQKESIPTVFDDTLFLEIEERSPNNDVIATETVFSKVEQALKVIPPRERAVIVQYYLERKKLKEIGETFGVSKERIRQLRSNGISRLKEMLVV